MPFLQSRIVGVGPPGAPPLGVRARVLGSSGRPSAAAPRRTPRSVAGTTSGSPSARIATYCAVHGPMPGSAVQPPRRSPPGRRRRRGRARRRRPPAPAPGSSPAARPASRTPRPAASSNLAGSGRSGDDGVPPSSGPVSQTWRSQAGEHGPRAERPRPAGRRSPGPPSRSRPPRAGTRTPGSWRPAGASAGSAASMASTATGSASRSSSRRQRATAGARSRTSASRSVAATCPAAGVSADRAGAVRQPQTAVVRPVADLLDARQRPAREELEQRARRAAAAGTASRSVIVPARGRPRSAARPAAQLRRALGRTPRGRVSLNCRTLPNPAANAISARPSSVVSIRIRAVCARCARASASGPAPTSARQHPVQVPLGVAEPGGQPGHAVPVDHAVGDQPHRAADHVGADVPLRRAGRGVRPAAQAGPEARRAGRRPRTERTGRSPASGVIAGQDGRQ